jgi:hypothetical protein
MIVQRGGGGGNTTVTISLRRNRGGVITDLTERDGIGRFTADTTQTLTFVTPVQLQYGDLIVPIASRDAGTVTILQGSNYEISVY